MRMRFDSLVITCHSAEEHVDFGSQVTFIHGPISSGKSTIARLLDYCLGADLDPTPAVQHEFVKASAFAVVGAYEVLLEREARNNQVQVTWSAQSGVGRTTVAPLQEGPNPIFDGDIWTLSDLLYHLQGIRPPRIRSRRDDDSAKLVRLGFRNLLWYCYLPQDRMDSSFFRLHEPMLQSRSRAAIRFVLGYHSEALDQLQAELEAVRQRRRIAESNYEQVTAFLAKSGIGTRAEAAQELDSTIARHAASLQGLAELRQEHAAHTHFADELRDELRAMAARLAEEEQALADLRARIVEQQALKAELITAKLKAARGRTATDLLAGAVYVACPSCGRCLPPERVGHQGVCRLCGQDDGHVVSTRTYGAVEADLSGRIAEVDESLGRHQDAQRQQERTVDALRTEKARMDARLSQELAVYDSAFLSQARALERQVAAFEERREHWAHTITLHDAVDAIMTEASALAVSEQALQTDVSAERARLTRGEENIHALEEAYREALVAVGVPGVTVGDRVEIDRTTWVPAIVGHGEDGIRYSYEDAGSGGKKTLLKVCFALALHQVAAERNLPLPSVLILDTPMKNIDDQVNRDVFIAFYQYLFRLAKGPLRNTQFIIIDSEYPAEVLDDEVDVSQRYMTPDDPDHPPLISYYRGP